MARACAGKLFKSVSLGSFLYSSYTNGCHWWRYSLSKTIFRPQENLSERSVDICVSVRLGYSTRKRMKSPLSNPIYFSYFSGPVRMRVHPDEGTVFVARRRISFIKHRKGLLVELGGSAHLGFSRKGVLNSQCRSLIIGTVWSCLLVHGRVSQNEKRHPHIGGALKTSLG